MNPALGGLSACIRWVTPMLTAMGHPTEIVCLDAPGAPFLAEIPAPVHALGPTRLGYGYTPRLLPWLKKEASRFDAVIVHGLWQYHGLGVYRALSRSGFPPYYGFPHGMLDPWFKRHYPLKHLKKLVYWWIAERRNLQRAAGVLFTCEEERRLARESFPGSTYRECVVAYGTAAPPDEPERQREAFFQIQPGLRDRPYWLFLGRIHEKKGVDLLIDAYGQLAAQGTALPHLVIAGPCAEAAYLRQLQKRAATNCPPDTVVWPGMLTGDAKWGAFRGAEAFVLPSHQENFGIAVSEALACGTPVLISDQVNIWREVTGDGAGLAEPDTAAGTLQLLIRWRALDAAARARMREVARQTFQERFEIGAVARSLIAALQEPPSQVLPFPPHET